MTLTEQSSKPQSAGRTGHGRRWVWPTGLVAVAAIGALVTLVTIWSIGSRPPTVQPSSSLQAGFGSNTMTIIDQDGTVNVDVWVKNDSRVTKSVTCAVLVTSG